MKQGAQEAMWSRELRGSCGAGSSGGHVEQGAQEAM